MSSNKQTVYVLTVVSQMNRGGLESRLMDIIRHINFERVHIDIYTYHLQEGIFDREAKKYGVTIYYNKTLTIKNMFEYIEYFKNFLLQHPQYKIIHAHQDAWCSVFCKGAYKAGVPVRIAHSRTAIKTNTVKDAIKNIIKVPTTKYATDYFAVSKEAGEWLYGKQNVKNGKVLVWQNAIDCGEYVYNKQTREEVRRELNLEDDIVIIHVGNFTRPKNHQFIIEIFEKFHEKHIKSKLILVGTDTNEKNKIKIENQVIEKKLQEQVLFLGMREDISRLLQAGDVFLFPSIYEGLPGAVVEAQASGLPCVISKNITQEVCILNSTKQLSLNAPISEWVDAIQDALLIQRKDTFDKMSELGFDIQILVEKLTLFYEEKRGKNGEQRFI